MTPDSTIIIIVNGIITVSSYMHCSTGVGFAVAAAPLGLNFHAPCVPAPLILGGMTLSALILVRESITPGFSSMSLYIAGKAIGAIIGTLMRDFRAASSAPRIDTCRLVCLGAGRGAGVQTAVFSGQI